MYEQLRDKVAERVLETTEEKVATYRESVELQAVEFGVKYDDNTRLMQPASHGAKDELMDLISHAAYFADSAETFRSENSDMANRRIVEAKVGAIMGIIYNDYVTDQEKNAFCAIMDGLVETPNVSTSILGEVASSWKINHDFQQGLPD